MEPEKKNTGIPFKDFLDKSTNLITVFGVFNALLLYATTIGNETSKNILFISFFTLSILVWFEIILFAIGSNNNSIKYDIFYFTACMVELGLVIFYVKAFAPLLLLLATFGVLFLYTYIVMRLFLWIYPKRFLRYFEKNRKGVVLVIFVISLLAAILLWILSSPFFKWVFQHVSITNEYFK